MTRTTSDRSWRRSVGRVRRPDPHERRSPADEAWSYERRLAVAVPLTVAVLWLTFALPHAARSQELAWLLSTPVVFYSGWPFLRAAARSALHGATTMDTLVALGSLSAYGYSAAAVLLGEHDHYFDTAAVIVTLILVGKVLEARARASAADASRALLDRGAKSATLLIDGRNGGSRSTISAPAARRRPPGATIPPTGS